MTLLSSEGASKLTIATLIVLMAMSGFATAYREEHGHAFVLVGDQEVGRTFTLLDSIAPGTVTGLLFYEIDGVLQGSLFRLLADDHQGTITVGTASSCPGPSPAPGHDSELPTEGGPLDPITDRVTFWAQAPEENLWLVCHDVPDLDIYFTGAAYNNGPGDEQGIVPVSGTAYVILVFGPPATSFTYSES